MLHSGTGGSGTTTSCRANAEALAASEQRVAVIDGSQARSPHPDVAALLAATVGRIMADVGADPVHPSVWAGLGIVGHLSVLRSVLDALADPSVDVVLVDCGPIERARELIAAPAIIERLLDAALTPRLAMWRSGEDEDASPAFKALSAARSEAYRMRHALDHPDTVMRLVTTPDETAVARIIDAASAFAVLGVGVEGVFVTGLAHDDPDDVAQLGRLRQALAPVEIWDHGVRPQPLVASSRLTEDAMVLRAEGEEYTLDLPLAAAAGRGARVGRLGDDVVVEFGTARRWLPLPPVLTRCDAVKAVRCVEGLRLTFTPDAAVWRQRAGAQS